jgi:hypothetical protein
MSLILWILALATLLFAVHAVAHPFLGSRAAKLLFLPGVLLAVLSRSLACALSGAPLKSVNLPWREGEPVDHDRPYIPVWGAFALALVPVAAAFAGAIALREALGLALDLDVPLPRMDASIGALATFLDTAWAILQAAWRAAHDPQFRDWRVVAYLYGAFSALVFAAPNYEEWKALASGTAAAGGLVAFARWLGLSAGFMSRGWFIEWLYGDSVFEALSLLLATALVSLAVLAAVRAATSFTRAAFFPKKRKKA